MQIFLFSICLQSEMSHKPGAKENCPLPLWLYFTSFLAQLCVLILKVFEYPTTLKGSNILHSFRMSEWHTEFCLQPPAAQLSDPHT